MQEKEIPNKIDNTELESAIDELRTTLTVGCKNISNCSDKRHTSNFSRGPTNVHFFSNVKRKYSQ